MTDDVCVCVGGGGGRGGRKEQSLHMFPTSRLSAW